MAYFYPRPPRGGRPCRSRRHFIRLHISIHALREEGDPLSKGVGSSTSEFLSTPSARRATIRNPGEEIIWSNFYPRPPRGGRQISQLSNRKYSVFLSTPSARRATYTILWAYATLRISIHALREEGDLFFCFAAVVGGLFLSTPSARRATSGRRWCDWLH